mmetsp:Transcript_24928/g.22119  ORF Transcript_24928/g.22119 Transcript_24928/m.22119 type:complete len:181 (+) Transcript_24928:200-742(+)
MSQKRFHLDIEHAWREDRTAVVAVLDEHAVEERRDVKHIKQLGFGDADLVTGCANLLPCQDVDVALDDLRWEVERLEERRFLGVHAGRAGLDPDVHWRKNATLGRSLHLVLFEKSSHFCGITVSKDKADVALDSLDERVQARIATGLFRHIPEALAHERVLTHEDLALPAELVPHRHHLL